MPKVRLEVLARHRASDWAAIKRQIEQLADKAEPEAYNYWMSWEPTPTQCLLYTFYAPEGDCPFPIAVDTIEDRQGQKQFAVDGHILGASVVIATHILPVLALAEGHKHLCICSFQTEVPPVLQMLDCIDKWQPRTSRWLFLVLRQERDNHAHQ